MKDIYGFLEERKAGLRHNKNKIVHRTISFIREFFIKNDVKKIRCLSLPSAFWIVEREIERSFPYNIRKHFVGCERDYKIYKIASIRIPIGKLIRISNFSELNCSITTNGRNHILFNCDVFSFLRKTDRKFNLIWLDSESFLETLSPNFNIIARSFQGGPSVFILNVCASRDIVEYDRAKIMDNYVERSMPDFKKAYQWKYLDSTPMLHGIYYKDYSP